MTGTEGEGKQGMWITHETPLDMTVTDILRKEHQSPYFIVGLSPCLEITGSSAATSSKYLIPQESTHSCIQPTFSVLGVTVSAEPTPILDLILMY